MNGKVGIWDRAARNLLMYSTSSFELHDETDVSAVRRARIRKMETL